MARRPRVLSREERRLWAAVAGAVKPMPGRAIVADEGPPVEELSPRPAPAVVPRPERPQPARPALPPLAPLERRTLRALSRGLAAIESKLALHGMRQADAHEALRRFLAHSQRAGRRIVLVVTGKGGGASDGVFGERGVLRRMVPHWLRLPDLRLMVLGFEPAAPHHGGDGALYVRLRRRPG